MREKGSKLSRTRQKPAKGFCFSVSGGSSGGLVIGGRHTHPTRISPRLQNEIFEEMKFDSVETSSYYHNHDHIHHLNDRSIAYMINASQMHHDQLAYEYEKCEVKAMSKASR